MRAPLSRASSEGLVVYLHRSYPYLPVKHIILKILRFPIVIVAHVHQHDMALNMA